MATAVRPNPAPAAKYGPELDEHIDQATRRIRANDVFTGVLILVAIVLGYVVTMVAVDRWADVPSWGRQVGLVGLCGVLAVVGYLTVLRPLRRIVNPLYAAKQVEETVPDAKNSIVNYVDLHDEPMPESVREAVGARAAKQLEAADLNEAVNPRGLVRAGAAVAGLAVVLAVLFLVFRPTQFFSLLGRTLSPFSAGAIATRTEIVVIQPAGGDAMVTAGQAVTVAVGVNGRVPDADGPDRLRVRLRHNPDDANAEEVPLEPAGSNREWQARVPEHLVQNGFWYTVAGGDAVTPEYKVTVRSRPLFTGFEARYEYPAYLRLKPEVVREAQLEGYRGTQVTLTAKANRELKSGRLVVAGEPSLTVPGEVVGDARDSLRFRLTLADGMNRYQLFFVATTDEPNADSVPYPITVQSDQPPMVTITAPKEEEVTLPLNGSLKVDAAIGDDFGIDTVTLRLRLVGGRVLQSKPYQDGKSFRRETDNTYPTSLEYKDSVPLAAVKGENGEPVPLPAGTVIEYWLEAADNCTVPKANVGKSKVQRVRVVEPPAEPMKQQEEQQQAADRKQTEAKHRQQQNQKFQNERRDPPPQPRPEAAEKQPDDPQRAGEPGGTTGETKAGGNPQSSDPMRQDQPPGGPPEKPNLGAGEPSPPPMPMGGPPEQPAGPDKPMPGGPENKTPATPPPAAGDNPKPNDIKQEAQQLDQKLNEQQQPGAEARGAGDPRPESAPPSGERKGQPEAGTTPPAEKKPDPGQPDQPNSGDPDTKPQPLGGTAGTDKPSEPRPPKDQQPTPQQGPKPANAGDPPPKAGADNDPSASSPKPGAGERPPQAGEKKTGSGPPPSGATPETKSSPEQSPMSGGSEDPAAAKKPAGGQAGRPKADPKEMQDAVKNLASGNEQQKQAARDKLDQAIGKQAREEAEQLMNDLKSGNPAKQEAARKKVEDAVKQAEKLSGEKPTPNPDGTPERDAERLMRAREQQELHPENVKPNPNGPSEKDLERLHRQAQNLNSSDPDKRKQAEEQLDRAIGKEAREELQQRMKDAKPGDPGQDQKDRQRIEEMAKKQQARNPAGGDPQNQPPGAEKASAKPSDAQGKPGTEQPRNGGPNDPKVDPKEIEQAVKDLTSGDPKKQQEAREKLDKAVGQKARQDAEQLMKDLKSDDQATRQAAEKKLDELNKQAQQAAGQQPKREPTAEEKKQLADAAKDLASDDPKKQQAARDKLDQMVGKDARQQAEQTVKDLNSQDAATRAAAEKKLADMQKQVNGGQPKKDLTPQEKQQLADIAKDLGSKDPAKQKEAGEKFGDTPLAKDLAEGLKRQAENLKDQQADPAAQDPQKALDAAKNLADLEQHLNDLKAGDPKKAEEAMKNLKDLAEKMKNRNPPRGDGRPEAVGRGMGGNPDTTGTPLKANEDYGKLTSELQLEKFKKAKDDPELLKKLGYTPQDFDRFLKGFEEAVKQDRQERDQDPRRATAPQPTEPAVNVGETSTKVEQRTDGSKGNPQGSGPAYAPPGYSDAQKKFLEKTTRPRGDDKK